MSQALRSRASVGVLLCAACLLTAVTALAGCGGDADEGDQAYDRFHHVLEPPELSAEQSARYSEAVEECMAAEGFEYQHQVDPVVVFTGSRSYLDDDDRRTSVGYGFAEGARRRLEVEREDDPNLEYVASLTPEEQQQYYDALYGEEAAELDEGEEFVAGGCVASGYDGLDSAVAVQSEMSDELDDLAANIQADDRLVGLEDEWSGCMAERGYQFRSSAALVDEMHADADEVVARYSVTGTTGGGVTAAEPELARLLDDELELAADDWACAEPSWGEYLDVVRDIEEAWFLRHYDELDRLEGAG
jgi:hypothetical protein